ncbi:Nramp family divalent metal transporter [Adhaeretor mobilis]|uniref:Divalent metal cation transporter MntH n=1 Tax=Adhaeretor mobilis TaxID=1930276 RepID=A0A517MW78_9BACT|nr:Nramp family divalent metal transporter [Adhaeretor mobilis]QDS99136.1 Divalent metal cation transporter MntH [Adhaeretor mobilis]
MNPSNPNCFLKWFRTIGPGIIVASVVLGPGSILTSSKVGCQYGYSMLWVLVAAVVLMIGMTALAARLGVSTEKTLCSELADRIGRPFASMVGIVLFLVVASFQSSNNMAVVTSIESVLPSDSAASPTNATKTTLIVLLVLFNTVIIATLFGLKSLYKPLERLMKVLLGVMIVGFGANLFLAGPSLSQVLSGLVPRIPSELAGGFWPRLDGTGQIVDPLWAIQGLVATTFSVAGAFYQSYLAREKGWTSTQLKQGLVDSIVGISVLGACSSMIMITSATILHGTMSPHELRSAADVARQLEPLFGPAATILFSCGIFAACFSPFLINAMIGGLLLADGLGLGNSMDSPWSKTLTVAAMLFGMAVAIWATIAGENPVGVIIFAQALTVLGSPLLALSLLYLATRRDVRDRVSCPAWLIGVCSLGCVVTLVLATRTACKLWLQTAQVPAGIHIGANV